MRRALWFVAASAMLAGPSPAQPIITTVAGNGTDGFCGDGGPATSACLHYPSGSAVDAAGNLFIADFANHRIRKVDPTGTITTVAGNGTMGFCGDGGPAIGACLRYPPGVALDTAGHLFIADRYNHRIRKVDVATGIITTVAGNGTAGFCGDGGPATSACLNDPQDVAVDAAGRLFIADAIGSRIRKVDATGTITTAAGNGTRDFCGDRGPATSACLAYPAAVALDSAGNLLIADTNNGRIRKVDATGTITTVAGNGTYGFCGDGGPATSACLDGPHDVAVDPSGSLFIADGFNHRIRKVDATGTITTVAGNGTAGFCGDGGPATSACLNQPLGSAVDAAGNLFIAEWFNHRIRKVAGTPVPLVLDPLPGPLQVGGPNTLTGTGFTPGSVVKLFVATASGAVDHGPFTPSGVGATSLTWTIPAEVPLGNGFGAVQVINADQGYVASNVVTALLEGNPASGIPTIRFINGVGLGPADPGIAVAHIDTVVAQGATATIIGTAFSDPVVNLFTAAGNVGPLDPAPGGTATQVAVTVPATAPAGPGTFQLVNRTTYRASNAVAAVIGATPTITHVSASGLIVTVTGTGFSALSVINLYNLQGGTVVNLGGFGPAGARVPLTVLSPTQFTFTRPADAVAGPAFIEVLNPPFIPFSSSGSDPDGAFTFPAAPAWSLESPTASPPPRDWPAMAHDRARGQTVLFGGWKPGGVSGGFTDTWIWDGAGWTEQHPAASPPQLMGPAMTYDAARGEVVLVGLTLLGDQYMATWVWNGTTWTEKSTTTRPPNRTYFGLAFDAARAETVLFSGCAANPFNDTWVWDGSNWAQRFPATSPPARCFARIADHPETERVVLFGGLGSGPYNDTWTWDGTNWTRLVPGRAPAARAGQAMAYDAGLGGILLFGGEAQYVGPWLADTWLWDGTGWSEIAAPTSPSARAFAPMVYDNARGEIVLFGSTRPAPELSDTWVFRTGPGPQANLRVTALKAPSAVAIGATFTIRHTTRNDGPGTAGPSRTALWLSTDRRLGGDTLLVTRAVPALAAGTVSGGSISVPLPALDPGTYYLLAQADGDSEVLETSETDNLRVRAITVSSGLTADPGLR